ncbi:MAG: hypothetical protein PUB96_05630 [Helicobacteraceae bacterium]|nr:hypothetical protein [Helicobacteraceae bacterium]
MLLKTTDEKGNVIYHYEPLEVILQNSKIDFGGGNNIVFLDSGVRLVDSTILLENSGSLVFLCASILQNFLIELHFNSVCYLGRIEFANPNFTKAIFLTEGRNLILGDGGLLSCPITISSTDWHIIYDVESKKRVNDGKNIFIGDNCWIGESVDILKGAKIYSGSIVGLKSVVVGKKYFSNTINAGIPAKEIKQNIFWDGDCSKAWDKAMVKKREISKIADRIHAFNKDEFLNPTLIFERLESLGNPQEKLEFIYDYVYNNTHKNRFALFCDSVFSECELYKVESKAAFRDLEIKEAQEAKEVVETANNANYHKIGGGGGQLPYA